MDFGRQRELLKETANGLDDGKAPLSEEFLAGHEVTFEEAMDLSTTMCVIIRGYLDSPGLVQKEVLLRGSMSGHMPDGLSDLAVSFLKSEDAFKGVRNHGQGKDKK